MSQIHYIHTQDTSSGDEAITVFVIGVGQDSCDNTHPNFAKILDAAVAGDEDVLELFDVERTVAQRFNSLSERVSVAHGVIYLDGDPIDNSLTRQVLAFLNQGVEDWEPLVNFFEKVQANPNEHSREQLYGWLAADDTLTITPAGDIVGYKGVSRDAEGNYVSRRSGYGIVNNNVVQNGLLCNNVGNVVEMPRSKVQHDPGIACSYGLHVGTFSYAQSYASGGLLRVRVDPRDVVSVPTDCNGQKMRVCRYLVLEANPQRTVAAVCDDYDDDEEFYGDDEW